MELTAPSKPANETTPVRRKLLHWSFVAGFFFVLSIVQTWPLVLHLSDQAMLWAPDGYQHMWNLWWFKHRVLSLENPFRTDMLFYPQGSDLYMHTLTPVNGLFTTPLQLVSGNVMLAWGVTSLAFFTASGVGAYALAYRISRDAWASLVAGLIFAFSPFVMTHINGHLNISTTWPIPFFALVMIAFHESRRLRHAAMAGVLLSVMTWNWLEFAIDSVLFLAIFLVFWSVLYLRRRDREGVVHLARGAAVAGLVWLPLSLPILIPSLYEVLSGDVQMRSGLSAPAEFYSADLAAFVSPSPLWGPGKFSNCDCGQFPAVVGGVETTVFLGVLPLILAVIAIAWHRRTEARSTVAFWGLVFAFFAVMSLGPFLYINGDKTFDLGFAEVSVSLPFRLFKELPLVGLRRVPARMIVYASLAVAVLAPLGLTAIAQALRLRPGLPTRALAVAAFALVLLEVWNPPVSLTRYTVPEIYEEISREPGDFTLLELPVGRITGTQQRGDINGGAMSNYSQITHGKASIGGYFSRGNEKDVLWLREQPGIGYLSCPVCPGFPRPVDQDRERVLELLNELRVRYVILNLQTFEGQPSSLVTDGKAGEVQSYLQRFLRLESAGSGPGWRAYRVPGAD